MSCWSVDESWKSAGSVLVPVRYLVCACCMLTTTLGRSTGDHKSGGRVEVRKGMVVWALVLEFFSPLSFSISSIFSSSSPLPCSPYFFLILLFSSQRVQYNKASSRMEGDCTVPSMPVAQDSRDSCPDPAIGSVAALPRDSASPNACTSGTEKPLVDKQDPAGGPVSQEQMLEQECLIDSQPILFSQNPFVVANRRGKSGLGGPPLGYGRGGVLQTSLYSKASSSMVCGMHSHRQGCQRTTKPLCMLLSCLTQVLLSVACRGYWALMVTEVSSSH